MNVREGVELGMPRTEQRFLPLSQIRAHTYVGFVAPESGSVMIIGLGKTRKEAVKAAATKLGRTQDSIRSAIRFGIYKTGTLLVGDEYKAWGVGRNEKIVEHGQTDGLHKE